MRIQTYSILVGGSACNCRCPRCVSKMTPSLGVENKTPEVNWRNFHIGCKFAKANGVSTVLLTGKGEPTLYPDLVSKFVNELYLENFSLIELQTNGFLMSKLCDAGVIDYWYQRGLTTIAISIVHYDNELNIRGMRPMKQPEWGLAALISSLHYIGFSVRLSCILEKGYIASWPDVLGLIKYAKRMNVEQLSIRSVEMPAGNVHNQEIMQYVREHKPSVENMEEIRSQLMARGTQLLHLAHGAIVFDYEGQNVCLTNCLTRDPNPEEVRQLIFFPDGHLRYDWVCSGALLL